MTRPRFLFTRANGRPVYANDADRYVVYGGPTGYQPSPRRFVFYGYRDGSSRIRPAGAEVIGHPVYVQPINYPRRSVTR